MATPLQTEIRQQTSTLSWHHRHVDDVRLLSWARRHNVGAEMVNVLDIGGGPLMPVERAAHSAVRKVTVVDPGEHVSDLLTCWQAGKRVRLADLDPVLRNTSDRSSSEIVNPVKVRYNLERLLASGEYFPLQDWTYENWVGSGVIVPREVMRRVEHFPQDALEVVQQMVHGTRRWEVVCCDNTGSQLLKLGYTPQQMCSLWRGLSDLRRGPGLSHIQVTYGMWENQAQFSQHAGWRHLGDDLSVVGMRPETLFCSDLVLIDGKLRGNMTLLSALQPLRVNMEAWLENMRNFWKRGGFRLQLHHVLNWGEFQKTLDERGLFLLAGQYVGDETYEMLIVTRNEVARMLNEKERLVHSASIRLFDIVDHLVD